MTLEGVGSGLRIQIEVVPLPKQSRMVEGVTERNVAGPSSLEVCLLLARCFWSDQFKVLADHLSLPQWDRLTLQHRL